MPVAIGIAILGESLAATEVIAGITLGSAVGYGVTAAATLGAQLAIQAINDNGKVATEQLTVRQAIAARSRGHGRAKLGGVFSFFDTQNGVVTRGVVHCVGPITTIREYWLGDIKTSLPPGAGGLIPDAVYQGKVSIEGYRGTIDQAASPALQRYPYWSPAGQLKGLSYTVTVCTPLRHGDKIFPEGAPDVRIVADLVACFDPRDPTQSATDPTTWRWTDNAALVLLEYLSHSSGYGIPFEEFEFDSWKALADVCDEPVPLRVADPAGATVEPRYRSWGVYKYDAPRAQVLARYLAACDAEIYDDADGRVAVRGGRWQEPTFTITQDMVLGWDEFEEGDEAYATFNQLTFTYTSPVHDYQPIEGDPLNDLDAQAVAGIISTPRDFRRAPSHSQGRRLGKIAVAKAAPRFRFTGLRLRPVGLRAYGKPTVRLVLPSVGIDATFAVSKGTLSGASLSVVKLDIYSLGPEAYAWSPIEEGNAPPLPDQDAPDQPPVPTGIAVQIIHGMPPSAQFSAAAVAGRDDLTLIGRYRKTGDTAWMDMDRQNGQPAALNLTNGTAYQGEVAWISSTSIGDWSAPITVTPTAG